MRTSEVQVEILPDGRMTTSECAKYTGFSESSLAHFRVQGKGPPFVKIEGKIFYRKEQVDRWLKKR